ncbi:hypothetical protein LAD67_10510 [Escherichia coli]|nr:hypothetical protein [Escherichia coli]
MYKKTFRQIKNNGMAAAMHRFIAWFEDEFALKKKPFCKAQASNPSHM